MYCIIDSTGKFYQKLHLPPSENGKRPIFGINNPELFLSKTSADEIIQAYPKQFAKVGAKIASFVIIGEEYEDIFIKHSVYPLAVRSEITRYLNGETQMTFELQKILNENSNVRECLHECYKVKFKYIHQTLRDLVVRNESSVSPQ